MYSATCMQLLFKIQIDLNWVQRTNRAIVSKGDYHSIVVNMHFTNWPPGVAGNGFKLQKMPVGAESCIPFVCVQFPFFLDSFYVFWALIEQLQPSLDPAHTVWKIALNWELLNKAIQPTEDVIHWLVSSNSSHTHCRTIRSDAICFTAPKRCIWRSLQTEGSVCLMQWAWRTCFKSTKAADDKFPSSACRFLSWLHHCFSSLSSPHPVPG